MARRSGLGKGLGALIPAEVRDRSSALREVPTSSIRPNPLQPRTRFDEEAMSSLAASIKEVGVLQPILVREAGAGEYELIAGERRWRAARRAGLQTMPVLVQAASDVHSLEQALVENLHREDLNPLEEAAAYQQLVDTFDYTHEQVAARVGKSRTAVTNTLRLLQLPAGVQRALADGAMTAGHARALLGTPDRAFQEDLARRTVAEGLTVRAVEDLVRRHGQPGDEGGPSDQESAPADGADTLTPRPAPSPTATPAAVDTRHRLPAPGVLELEELLSAHLNTRVKVEMGSKRGRVVIDFATLEDLERIYKLMVGGAT
ncbi:MAG: ParB/RepB/Spo0J family partition protein [Acidobacteriota bacterium]|nr:ParB/RepB/Spo0J family partition protein [Acidobacteriota bacterium]